MNLTIYDLERGKIELQRAIRDGRITLPSQSIVDAIVTREMRRSAMRRYSREWQRAYNRRLATMGLTRDKATGRIKPRKRPFYPWVTPGMTPEQRREYRLSVQRECMRRLRAGRAA